MSNDECNSIISLGESSDIRRMKSSKFKNGILVDTNSEYNGNKRSGCYFTNPLKEEVLKNISQRTINLINDISPFNSLKYNGIKKFSFNRYSSGDFLDWHEDNHEILHGATITCIYQLNENYSGGEILLFVGSQETSIKKSKGSIFIFDPKISHSIKLIEDGKRYSMNSWPSSSKINVII